MILVFSSVQLYSLFLPGPTVDDVARSTVKAQSKVKWCVLSPRGLLAVCFVLLYVVLPG